MLVVLMLLLVLLLLLMLLLLISLTAIADHFLELLHHICRNLLK
jgi:hypothetical protein